MRLVCLDEPVRLGLLLDDGAAVLDLAHPACALPPAARGARAPEAFDLDGELIPAACALHARLATEPELGAALRAAGALRHRAGLRLLAPVPRPGKILCIGRNYAEHAAESEAPPPERPLLFSKFPSAVCAPGDEVRVPRGSTCLDWEAELGVVVGRRAHRVPAARALEHVLGYVNFNDLTARDFQRGDGQWQRGKSCDTLAPFGEAVVTTDEVPDPQALRIRMRLNGETMQDSSTARMIFGVATLIEVLSENVTLEPGDVLATGTPAGVGFARKPPVWLRPGDLVEVEVEGLGVLRNRVAAGEDSQPVETASRRL